MHWFEACINDYREFCHKCGFEAGDCDDNCRWCDEFRDYLRDDIGEHENIWPYDFASQELYTAACTFANEADDIIADEEVGWWNGDSGYVQGISSPAVDPRDFTSREEYEDALYHCLFEEAVSRHAVIPNTTFWFHTYVNFLNDLESVYCADKSILALLDELKYCENPTFEYLTAPPVDELEREIRYSSWKKPRIESRSSGYYSSYYYCPNRSRKQPAKRYRTRYTEEQFRNDLFYHYPELLNLVNGIAHHRSLDRRCKLSQAEEYIEEYLSDVLITAFYIHDMFDFSVEECVQNGLEGILRGIKNNFWDQNTPRWMWRFDQETRKEQYILWEMRLYMIQYSEELSDYLGFTMDRKAAKVIEAIMFERRNPNDLSPDDFSSDYRDREESTFLAARIKNFFNNKNPIGLTSPQNVDELYFDCDAMLCRTAAINLLRELVNKLPEREKDCLILRYGFYSNKQWTLEEIGYAFNLSRERVRQIEKKAIDHLKKLPNYVDLCELGSYPIPKDVKYLSFIQSGNDNLQGADLSETNQLEKQASQLVKDYVNTSSYNILRRRGIVFINQLLALNEEQLKSLSISIKWWYAASEKLQRAGIAPSEALFTLIRPYRPPTKIWIADCGFSTKFHRVMTRADIYRLDTLQAMSVSQLKRYKSISNEDWLQVDIRIREIGVVPSEAIMELAGTNYE